MAKTRLVLTLSRKSDAGTAGRSRADVIASDGTESLNESDFAESESESDTDDNDKDKDREEKNEGSDYSAYTEYSDDGRFGRLHHFLPHYSLIPSPIIPIFP
jgi:hypothetical protein